MKKRMLMFGMMVVGTLVVINGCQQRAAQSPADPVAGIDGSGGHTSPPPGGSPIDAPTPPATVPTPPSEEAAKHAPPVLQQNGKILFTSQRDGYGIYVMDADGGNATKLIAGGSFGSMSPDGTKIAYGFNAYSGGVNNVEVYVANADGSGRVRLTNSPGYDSGADWSPDGSKIAFHSYREINGSIGSWIYVMNADGTNPTRLTVSGSSSYPDWSPDGNRIIFSHYRGGSHVYVMNADGTNQESLTTSSRDGVSVSNYAGSWSPDGTKIAFSSSLYRESPDIYVMNADGTNVVNITNNSGVTQLEPDWSPDGSQIAFVSGPASDYEVYTMNADGTNQTNVSNSAQSDTAPDWF